MESVERLLTGQAHYYRERAGEYEDWWFRRGCYDHGPRRTRSGSLTPPRCKTLWSALTRP